MAWIYFQESEGSRSLCPDSLEQLPIVNVTDTHKAFYCLECDQVSLTQPPSGTTLQHCKVVCCQELTSSPEDFHAKTSALLGVERAWMESVQACSLKFAVLLASADLDSYSWKTCQQSLFEASTEFVWNSMRSGMIVDGQLSQPEVLEHHTEENGGFYLPTPDASPRGPRKMYDPRSPKQSNRTLQTFASAFPEPNTFPDDPKKAYPSQTSKDRQSFPTPCARDWKDNGKSPSEMKRNSTTLATIAGGQLSPQWVEWLMGYRTGFTELSVLEMEWFRSKS